MPCRSTVRVAALLIALLAPWPWAAAGARSETAAPAEAKVIGAPSVNLRSCAKLSCGIRGTVPLGQTVRITGASVDGFSPVKVGAKSGFIFDTFLYDPSGERGVPNFEVGEPGCDRVALIFNIGAGHPPAESILDYLDEADVPATMFPMGWWAERYPALIRRMADEGFPVGSHGHSPPELTERGDGDIAFDLEAAGDAITEAAGRPVAPLFTPYADAIDDRVRAIAADLGYLPVGWDVSSGDWSPDATADGVEAAVVDAAVDGSIIELHLDAITSADSTAVALPRIVARLEDRGLRFVTIPELAEPCP